MITAKVITIIGKLENVEEAIEKLQQGPIDWFVISSEPSKKIKDTQVVKLIKQGDKK